MLSSKIMNEKANELVEMLEDNYAHDVATDIIRERIRNEYDGDIWERADEEGCDFDTILLEVCYQVEILADGIIENYLK